MFQIKVETTKSTTCAVVESYCPTRTMSLLLILALITTTPALSQEEPQEVAIIKQINRVNEDGTYTFGYEAADGSFKIETRDVLGNVKGMFGFIDDTGELKRVSYSASNGTGFQATGNIVRPEQAPTRRPVLFYRGPTRSPVIQHIPRRSTEDSTPSPATTPTLDYGQRTYHTTTTPVPDTQRPPVRVLVTKRPVVNEKSVNLIRRQLLPDQARPRDSQDIYQPGVAVPRVLPQRFRYPQIVGPDPREVYRNMLLEQNNLKPEYSSRVRYYTPVDEEEYPDVPAVVPMVDRVLASRPRFRPPAVVDQSGYPVPERRYPVRVPRPYDDYLPPLDYEALREEIMNYLIQYLQFRARRINPYYYYQHAQSETPYYPPPRAPYYPRYPVSPAIAPTLPPVLPAIPPAYPGYSAFSSPNVQYSQPEQQSQHQQEETQSDGVLGQLKDRMDRHDHRDSSDTRPPSSALIRMLLARPSTQRPAVRSVEIIGTAASSHGGNSHTSTTTTTTEQPDEMVAAS
ncbi:uncharacterized protein isoform X1 [Rhodnius prolixus]|uniref:uncharacterized protein isoform X1 n=1 Tax=Rhodnius prolixus TaxID=13249 RepID=UPI003D189705